MAISSPWGEGKGEGGRKNKFQFRVQRAERTTRNVRITPHVAPLLRGATARRGILLPMDGIRLLQHIECCIHWDYIGVA